MHCARRPMGVAIKNNDNIYNNLWHRVYDVKHVYTIYYDNIIL